MKNLILGLALAGLLMLLAFCLYGCSANAAPSPAPVPPPVKAVTCEARIQGMVIQGLDARGYPIIAPVDSFNTAVCGCSDGLVRWGDECEP